MTILITPFLYDTDLREALDCLVVDLVILYIYIYTHVHPNMYAYIYILQISVDSFLYAHIRYIHLSVCICALHRKSRLHCWKIHIAVENDPSNGGSIPLM